MAHFTAERRKPLRAAIARAVERGEIPPVRDLDVLDDLLLGPLFYRRLIAHRPVPDGMPRALVDQVLEGRDDGRSAVASSSARPMPLAICSICSGREELTGSRWWAGSRTRSRPG